MRSTRMLMLRRANITSRLALVAQLGGAPAVSLGVLPSDVDNTSYNDNNNNYYYYHNNNRYCRQWVAKQGNGHIWFTIACHHEPTRTC